MFERQGDALTRNADFNSEDLARREERAERSMHEPSTRGVDQSLPNYVVYPKNLNPARERKVDRRAVVQAARRLRIIRP